MDADVSDCLLLELTILDEERALCMTLTPEVLQSGLEEIVTTVRYRVSALALLSVDILAYRQDIHGLVSYPFDFTTDSNPALGHPIELICLDKDEPAVCKDCGLRYVQGHHH
ncbi:hypothetical protein SASPL_107467 [Salvia splendens]|uniref:Zinc finger CHCC-type domain-containing protein n=1 Tax=Salvia splendens TaxID=180675 RepID=A0A8X9A6I3_SALSN|nr:hypothetical protein SASPL_107467 [Salvia splendens]